MRINNRLDLISYNIESLQKLLKFFVFVKNNQRMLVNKGLSDLIVLALIGPKGLTPSFVILIGSRIILN